MALRLLAAAWSCALLMACSGDPGTADAAGPGGSGAGCGLGEREVAGKGCMPAGVQDDGCAAGETGVEGGCVAAGVPPQSCAQGFEADGDGGCVPILPARACPMGLMALPGETACREVAPCGAGTWGDIPDAPGTQYVDGAYAGDDSDGTQTRPWKTIQEGVDAAGRGTVVAVAEGSYLEDVRMSPLGARLWGRCPARVEIVGTGDAIAALFVPLGASATEVHDIAIRGPALGIVVSGSLEVVLDRVWVHDTGRNGVSIEDGYGPTRVTVQRSLIESASEIGVYVAGAQATIDETVIVGTRPRAPDETGGEGILAEVNEATNHRSSVEVRSSVVDRNRHVGIYVQESDATVEATVIRGTQPQASDDKAGEGIVVQQGTATEQPRASIAVRSSVISDNREIGVLVDGSDATIETTVIERTLPQASDERGGLGVYVYRDPVGGQRSTLDLRASAVRDNLYVGVLVVASEARIEATVVEDTQVQLLGEAFIGRGIQVENDAASKTPASATIVTSVVQRCFDIGIAVSGAEATIQGTVVRDTLPLPDGSSGDGVTAFAEGGASIAVTASRIEGSARAAISSFGSSVELAASAMECNAIDLDGEAFEKAAYEFSDLGGNVCGCSGTSAACKVSSTGLTPPAPLAAP